MQYQHSIAHLAAGIFLRRAQRVVVQLHFRKLLAGLELKILYDECAVLWRRVVGGAKRQSCKSDKQNGKSAAKFHEDLLKTEKTKSWKETRKAHSRTKIDKVSPMTLIRYTIFYFLCV